METETQTENSISHNTEEDICVDQIETAGNYFDIETGRPQSLDKVIVQSIERLSKFLLSGSINYYESYIRISLLLY